MFRVARTLPKLNNSKPTKFVPNPVTFATKQNPTQSNMILIGAFVGLWWAQIAWDKHAEIAAKKKEAEAWAKRRVVIEDPLATLTGGGMGDQHQLNCDIAHRSRGGRGKGPA